ncbi:hypothetical protein AB4097_21055 [Microvirga sp. 2MCAF35]|uniref:hypothetical protein n=1 Tax=Microvirga sp. 2MCAF35 TaxID=3232987 RepID=UPI003F987AE8
MNKPVFDQVTGEPINVGNVLDEALPGDVGQAEAAVPVLDFLTDELDGRRSIVADVAPTSSDASVVDEASKVGVADAAPEMTFLSKADASSASGETNASTSSLASGAEPSQSAAGDFGTLATRNVNGGPGNDYLDYRNTPPGSDSYVFHGNDGDDTIIGTQGSDQIYGDAGSDRITGWSGADTINVSDSNNILDYSPETGSFGIYLYYTYGSGGGTAVMGPDNRQVTYNTAYDTWGDGDKFLSAGPITDAFKIILGSQNSDFIRIYRLGDEMVVDGQRGDDDIEAGENRGDITIYGGAGADSLRGSRANDVLYAFDSSGNDDGAPDRLEGRGGNDVLVGARFDSLIGDSGNDTLIGGHVRYDLESTLNGQGNPNGDWVIDLAAGTGTLGSEVDRLINVSRVTTGAGADTIRANAIGSYMDGGVGNDAIYGGAGDDTLIGGIGTNQLYGSGGWDSIVGSSSDNRDTLTYRNLGGSVTIDLNTSVTTKFDGAQDQFSGIDFFEGTDYNDTFYGGAATDKLSGGKGNDKIWGGGGSDELYGGIGNDTLIGDAEGDWLEGGVGDDVYWADSQDTIIEHAGGGTDSIATTVSFSIANLANVENITIFGAGDVEVTGNAANNLLVGHDGRNTFRGGAGADTMIGARSDDTYYVDDLRDDTREYNGVNEGIDTAYVSVQYYDARKLDSIENKVLGDGIVLNYSASAPTIIGGLPVVYDRQLSDLVVDVRSTDDGIGGPLRYDLIDGGGGYFYIETLTDANGNTFGRIKMSDELLYKHIPDDGTDGFFVDGGGNKWVDLKVRAFETDAINGSGASEKISTIRIEILDVEYAPMQPTFSTGGFATTVREDARDINHLYAADLDEENVWDFVFDPDHGADANPNGLFQIFGRQLKVADGMSLNYEDLPQGQKYYTVYVRAIDPTTGELGEVSALRINVTDVNEGPVLQQVPITEIHEGYQTGDEVTDLFAQDFEGDGFSIRFTTGAVSGDGAFRIVGNSTLGIKLIVENHDAIQVAPGGEERTYEIILTDARGATSTATIVIHIADSSDLNIAPEIIVNGDTDWTIPDTGTVEPFQNLTFEDDDAGPNDEITIIITFDGSHGAITSAEGILGTDYFYDPVNDPNTFTVKGTVAWVNQLVHQLTFNPSDQYEGSDDRMTEFTVVVVDAGDVSSQPQTVTVIDTPANDAPTLTIPDAEDHLFVVQDNGEGPAGVVNPFIGLELGDSENDELTLQVKFNAPNGTLGNVDSIPEIVMVSHGNPDADGYVTYTFVGKKAALQAFLGGVTFDAFDDSAIDGMITTTFTFTLTDNLHAVVNAPDTVTVVTESSANIRPVLFIAEDTRTTNATDDGLAVYPFRGVDISDAEDDDLVLTITFLGTADQLQGAGSVEDTQNPDGTVTFRFEGKADVLDAILHQLTFNPQNGSADNAPFDTVFTISVNDAAHLPVSSQVVVHTVNGDDSGNMEPVIDVIPGTETTPAWSDGPAVFPFRGVDISDADNDLLTLTISFEMNEGELSGAGLPGTWTQMNGIRTYVLTGRADDLDAILHGLSFNPNDDAANETHFTITVQDSTHGPVSREVVVQTAEGGEGLTNEAPTIEFAPDTQTTPATDDGSAVYLFRGVDISDNENDQLILTIRFSEAAGQLSGFGSRQIITSLVDGIRTYIIMDTADNLDAFLHGLSFDPNPLAPDADSLDTIFDISVQDAMNPPVPAQVTVHTTHGTDGADNAAPTATFMEGTQETPATDDGLAVLPFRGLDLTDTDNDDLTVKISFDGSLGSLTGYDPAQVHVTTSGNTITLTFTGKADDLDGVLQALSYDPAHDKIGPTVFTITVQDLYHGPFSTTATVNTTDGGSPDNVNHAPDAPTWLDGAALKTIDETVAAGFEVGELTVSDNDLEDTVTVGFWYDNALHAVSEDNRFQIVNGVVKVLNADVDQATPDLPYLVRAVDSHGAFTESTIHIAITHVVDPSDVSPEIRGVNDPVSFNIGDDGAVLPFGNVTFWDPDSASITVTIALDSASEGFFENYEIGTYDELTGVYTVTGSIEDVQNAVRNLQFHSADRPNDPLGSLVTTNFTITVSDGNTVAHNTNISVVSEAVEDNGGGDEAPSNIVLSAAFVREHLGVGQTVGLLSAQDESPDTLTYTLVENGGGAFTLVGREIQVLDPSKIDFEQLATGEISFTVDVSDGVNPAVRQLITLGVENLLVETAEGTDGANILRGGIGSDRLNGHGGNDILSGGGGIDSLTGEGGADVFLFDSQLNTSAAGRNVDLIADFKRDEGDKIHLDLSIFAQAGTANTVLAAGAFVVNTTGTSQDADDRIIYNTTDGGLYYDPNGNGGASILFARVGAVGGVRPLLQADDFFLVP